MFVSWAGWFIVDPILRQSIRSNPTNACQIDLGIDISPMSVRHGQTPARRLRTAGKRTALARRTRLLRPPLICRRRGDETHFNSRCRFLIRASSRRLLHHGEFENWAVIALGGIPNKVQVGEAGRA